MTLVLPDLPPPSIIDESTYEEIFNSMIDEFREHQPSYTNIVEGDPVYSLAQRAAYRELNIRKQINNAYRQTLLPYATGANLDNVVANYGLTRLVKKEAVYDENGVLVEPEVLETDEQLRIRGWLVWSALGIGTFGKYKFHALQADPQVKDAFVKNTANGEVTVYVQSEDANGGVPAQALLDKVKAYLIDIGRRTLCDTLVVAGITTVQYEIAAQITVPPELNKTQVLKSVQAIAEDFASDNEVIDRDIEISRLYVALSAAGVAGVTLTKPTANVTTTDSQVPYATSVSITAA